MQYGNGWSTSRSRRISAEASTLHAVLAQRMDQPIRAFADLRQPLYDETRSPKRTKLVCRRDVPPHPITAATSPTRSPTRSGIPKRRCSTATALPNICSAIAVRDAGIKVVFTGEGADECWVATRAGSTRSTTTPP